MTRRRSGHAKGSRDPRDSSGVPGRLPFDDGSWTEGSMPEDHDPQPDDRDRKVAVPDRPIHLSTRVREDRSPKGRDDEGGSVHESRAEGLAQHCIVASPENQRVES